MFPELGVGALPEAASGAAGSGPVSESGVATVTSKTAASTPTTIPGQLLLTPLEKPIRQGPPSSRDGPPLLNDLRPPALRGRTPSHHSTAGAMIRSLAMPSSRTYRKTRMATSRTGWARRVLTNMKSTT
jgi:hypothetical protein